MESQSENNLRYIIIDDRTIYYKCFFDTSEWGNMHWTEFYEGTVKVTRKKYFIFGEEITVEEPKKIFTINADCDCPQRSRGWWRDKIMHELSILERSEELKRGELI
jgi:hypothetical protein